MDKTIVHADALETIKAAILVLLILAAFAFAGTLDHDQEVAHEQWMSELEAEGAWVLR